MVQGGGRNSNCDGLPPFLCDERRGAGSSAGEGKQSASVFVAGGAIGEGGLTQDGRKAVIGAFERRMDTLITHPLFKYSISYRRIMEVQARLLGRHLLGELKKYPAFTTR